jgi:hypothetical protein
MNLIRTTYLIIYQIENPIELNKKLTTSMVKWLVGPSQMGLLVKFNKKNDMLGQNG